MATNIQGPGIYLAQFASDTAPFDSWASITRWAVGLGFKGVQIPSWDKRIFDLEKAAESQTYCDEVAGVARDDIGGSPVIAAFFTLYVCPGEKLDNRIRAHFTDKL